jgi:hypothetical protein
MKLQKDPRLTTGLFALRDQLRNLLGDLSNNILDGFVCAARQFLMTFGPWYVNRFRSDVMPGINLASPAERNALWRGISVRVIRLNEFAAELRAQ